MIRAILEDVKSLKGRLEGMLETLIELYTDAFYEVKDEYLQKLEQIRKEKGREGKSFQLYRGI